MLMILECTRKKGQGPVLPHLLMLLTLHPTVSLQVRGTPYALSLRSLVALPRCAPSMRSLVALPRCAPSLRSLAALPHCTP